MEKLTQEIKRAVCILKQPHYQFDICPKNSDLKKLEENLNPGLSVVLGVGHQADAAGLEHGEEVLPALHHPEGCRLDVAQLLVHAPGTGQVTGEKPQVMDDR